MNMKVTAKTIPANLAAAVVGRLREDPELTISVTSIGEIASNIAAEAMGIARSFAQNPRMGRDEVPFSLRIKDGEKQVEVPSRSIDAKPGDMNTKVAREFIVTVEPIGADPE